MKMNKCGNCGTILIGEGIPTQRHGKVCATCWNEADGCL